MAVDARVRAELVAVREMLKAIREQRAHARPRQPAANAAAPVRGEIAGGRSLRESARSSTCRPSTAPQTPTTSAAAGSSIATPPAQARRRKSLDGLNCANSGVASTPHANRPRMPINCQLAGQLSRVADRLDRVGAARGRFETDGRSGRLPTRDGPLRPDRSTSVRRSFSERSTIEHANRERPIGIHLLDRRIQIAFDVDLEAVIDLQIQGRRTVGDSSSQSRRPPFADANDNSMLDAERIGCAFASGSSTRGRSSAARTERDAPRRVAGARATRRAAGDRWGRGR